MDLQPFCGMHLFYFFMDVEGNGEACMATEDREEKLNDFWKIPKKPVRRRKTGPLISSSSCRYKLQGGVAVRYSGAKRNGWFSRKKFRGLSTELKGGNHGVFLRAVDTVKNTE